MAKDKEDKLAQDAAAARAADGGVWKLEATRNVAGYFENALKDLYANEHLDKSDGKQITEDDVFIVWMCKTLQNSKAMASTTLFDGMYYELTYNGNKQELYLDAYKKWENKCIPVC